jgi:DNA-binding NtrC family response regulator
MPNLLIVDDNRRVAESLEKMLVIHHYACRHAVDAAAALAVVREGWPEAVLMDIMLGSDDGIACLRSIHEVDLNLPVIMITGFATIDNAVLSMKLGAFDFVQKPLDFEHLKNILNNAIKLRALQTENRDLHERIIELSPRPTFASAVMRDLMLQAQRLAATDLPVLIFGETGTGKELLADFIHLNSLRSTKPILKINCAAFPDSLLDNELFGHERGAYTGADTSFKGIFERADGGTLFLDEVGDMPLPIQTKILRVLQNSDFRRIGGSTTLKVDVRFIAATNKDLQVLIRAGSFREDLYFRLNVITLNTPALRDRPEDIPLLAEHFMEEFRNSSGCEAKEFSAETRQTLMKCQWPGNVRELKNVIMYACAMASGPTIGIANLPHSLSLGARGALLDRDAVTLVASRKYGLDPRSEAEAEVIKSVLVQCGYNKKRCAEVLKMSRNTLYRKIAYYGITDEGGKE